MLLLWTSRVLNRFLSEVVDEDGPIGPGLWGV
jgi:hypothetical protein